jgi:hypothetical protein
VDPIKNITADILKPLLTDKAHKAICTMGIICVATSLYLMNRMSEDAAIYSDLKLQAEEFASDYEIFAKTTNNGIRKLNDFMSGKIPQEKKEEVKDYIERQNSLGAPYEEKLAKQSIAMHEPLKRAQQSLETKTPFYVMTVSMLLIGLGLTCYGGSLWLRADKSISEKGNSGRKK